MKKILIALALALAACLPACTPPQSAGAIAAKAGMTLDQLEARYEQAKAFIDFARPILPPATIARIDATTAKVDAAFVRAHAAVTIAEQLAALNDAGTAIEGLERISAD